MLMVSSCLAGCSCRYNGTHCANDTVKNLVKSNQAISVCPEVLGGFPTPREPAEVIGGNGFDVWENKAKVMTVSGEDITEGYMEGARKALEMAKAASVTKVILKENSPSCGRNQIYNGKFVGEKVDGVGVAAALFIKAGIEVISDIDMEK